MIIRACITLTLGGALLWPASQFTKLSIGVRPSSLEVRGDTVRVSYEVTNVPASTLKLSMFTIDARTRAIRVERPMGVPKREYGTYTDFGFNVAGWSFLRPLLPGRTSPALAYSAAGLPGLVTWWAAPFVAPGREEPADVEVAASATDGPGRTAADSGITVGIVPFPADRSRAALLARLDGLITQSCTLGWVDSAGECNSLKVKVRSGAAEALLNELEAQRGKHVNDAAYFLFSGNARALPAS